MLESTQHTAGRVPAASAQCSITKRLLLASLSQWLHPLPASLGVSSSHLEPSWGCSPNPPEVQTEVKAAVEMHLTCGWRGTWNQGVAGDKEMLVESGRSGRVLHAPISQPRWEWTLHYCWYTAARPAHQGQAGRGSGLPGLVVGNPACSRGAETR